jgi:hypothetical protein
MRAGQEPAHGPALRVVIIFGRISLCVCFVFVRVFVVLLGSRADSKVAGCDRGATLVSVAATVSLRPYRVAQLVVEEPH